MKKAIALLMSLMLAGMVVGCGNTPADTTTDNSTPSSPSSSAEGTGASDTVVELSGTIATNGSTSMEKVIGALGEAFMNNNADVSVTYDPTGSGTGIQAVQEGRADIGLASRSLKDEEKESLTETVMALDGIAVIVNTENGVSDLSLEDISKIYTGEITNWKDVGGADAEIVLIGREANSGTRDGFESITGTEEKCQYKQELNSTGAVVEAVRSNPNAIGYASLSAVDETIKALTVGGVAPSEETVLDGSYQIQRPFVFATRSGEKLSDAAQAFMDFALSADSAEIIRNAGAVPVSE